MKFFILLSVIISIVVAVKYRDHQFGFWGVLLACLLTTPLIGWVIVTAVEFNSKWKRREEKTS